MVTLHLLSLSTLFFFHAKKTLDRERPFSLALRVVSLFSCLSRVISLIPVKKYTGMPDTAPITSVHPRPIHSGSSLY